MRVCVFQDACYFGVRNGFNARARANNFSIEEVSEVMQFLGAYGVKGFACLNVLVFDNELERVERSLKALERAGVDAVIVQDMAVMNLARRVAPRLKVHASTQASVTSAPGAAFLRDEAHVERVVLGESAIPAPAPAPPARAPAPAPAPALRAIPSDAASPSPPLRRP